MSTEHGSAARWQLGRLVDELGRLRRGPQTPLQDLERVRHAQEVLADVAELFARAARVEGASYADVGRALGITRQAARERLRRYEVQRIERAEDREWSMPARPKRRRLFWWRRRDAA